LKNLNDEETIFLTLGRHQDLSNFDYIFDSSYSEVSRQWEEIREFLKNSLGYYVNHLNILYDREKRLEINAVLD
jgi:hypothetical protein